MSVGAFLNYAALGSAAGVAGGTFGKVGAGVGTGIGLGAAYAQNRITGDHEEASPASAALGGAVGGVIGAGVGTATETLASKFPKGSAALGSLASSYGSMGIADAINAGPGNRGFAYARYLGETVKQEGLGGLQGEETISGALRTRLSKNPEQLKRVASRAGVSEQQVLDDIGNIRPGPVGTREALDRVTPKKAGVIRKAFNTVSETIQGSPMQRKAIQSGAGQGRAIMGAIGDTGVIGGVLGAGLGLATYGVSSLFRRDDKSSNSMQSNEPAEKL